VDLLDLNVIGSSTIEPTREFGFLHLPIVDGKELKVLVSSRDILLQYISLEEAEQRRMAV
jgi:hypothetical protein